MSDGNLPQTNDFLHTKLRPPRLHPEALQRIGLLELLDHGLVRKLILVSAPTGFGKTTLVSMWVASRKFPSAWVTLDVNDNDPTRFWTYVVSALRTFDSAIGRSTLAALSASQAPSFQSILTSLINDFAQWDRPCVLVLDDYHVITSAEIKVQFSFFLQHLPTSLHIVLTTRNDPDLPLPLLRVREELVEINATNLRFNQQEAESFLSKSLQMDISSTTFNQIFQKTEGWAAGLRLVALSLQNKGLGDIEKLAASFSGSDRYVAEYLIKEVFESQPQAVQQFLLKTCFLNRLTGELCDAVMGTNDGLTLLEQLERENLFLVRLEHGRGKTWYRYNSLFAESIQSLARARLGDAEIRSIFEKASKWFEYQQILDDAVEAALSANQYEHALILIERFIEIYSLSEMGTLSRWMKFIPDALIMQHPSVCMMYAQVILFTSDRYAPVTALRIEPYLNAAEKAWVAEGNEEKVGTVFALRGMMLLWQGQFQKSLEAVHQALEKMSESEVFWRGVSLLNVAGGEIYAGRMLSAQEKILEARALLGASQNIHGMLAANGLLSEIFLAQGELELCVQLNQQIFAEVIPDDESMLDDEGNAHVNLALVAYEQNELDSAEEHANTAFEFGKRRANELLESQAGTVLALIHTAKGEWQQAQEELKLLAASLQNPLAIYGIHLTQALILVRNNVLDIPTTWFADKAESLLLYKEREAFIFARIQIAKGNPAGALEKLQVHLAATAEHGRVRSHVEALCLQALGYHVQSKHDEAIQSLAQALTLGHEKGLRRSFLDEGQQMVSLLQASLSSLPNRTLSLFASTLLHSFPPGQFADQGNVGSAVLIEPLSQQEQRVLKLLVAGLSNGEIASELVVSANTIKTHVKSIYRKLNINSREEARTVAKELKLF
jgi:LuxR family maltose regulon positive regulatory protein